MVNAADEPQMALLPVAENLSIGDLARAVGAGWRDYQAYPRCGLVFSSIFVAAGILLVIALSDRSNWAWLIPAAAGFPILAPFAAAGFYEVSRRIETGDQIRWNAILGAVRGKGDDQLPLMGVISFVIFAFWVILAHTVFGIFMGEAGLGADPLTRLLTPEGMAMLAVGTAIGGMLAFGFFAMTVVSLPMLVDRRVDFISAIIVSFRVVRSNFRTMMVWALFVAIALFAAILPLFLGLLLVLPVLGHATWHLYRRAVEFRR